MKLVFETNRHHESEQSPNKLKNSQRMRKKNRMKRKEKKRKKQEKVKELDKSIRKMGALFSQFCIVENLIDSQYVGS